ncbi:uncharacterized protein B0I36DRAFT_62918 [Microdochium trichocladiopsis]|uniref:Uncharacterized protein n=1 Tax=Microdochium trichocladiopsis TaxID=1682393 RepID=A0A9P8YFY4_9PEZI|nr:uncharacterized protein B0I36DRAFT_62918 [Microdochium trichocladiopsis]KAH7037208.1 hypothetical protein B0I36DRAFT_62918 [Microdochium trichocladiopsis]
MPLSLPSPDRAPKHEREPEPQQVSAETIKAQKSTPILETLKTFAVHSPISTSSTRSFSMLPTMPRSTSVAGPATSPTTPFMPPAILPGEALPGNSGMGGPTSWQCTRSLPIRSHPRSLPCFFDLDSPHLPLHAASHCYTNKASTDRCITTEGRNEMICRFRAIHRPPHLLGPSEPLNFAAYGDVVQDTPEHLHINIRFEHLHMVHAIKQAWVERYTQPNAECVLRLGEPVMLDEVKHEIHLSMTQPADLIGALMPRTEEAGEAVSVHHPESVHDMGTAPAPETPLVVLGESVHRCGRFPTRPAPLSLSPVSPAWIASKSSMVDASTQTERGDDSVGESEVQVVACDDSRIVDMAVEGVEVASSPQARAATPVVSAGGIVLYPKKVESWAEIVKKS